MTESPIMSQIKAYNLSKHSVNANIENVLDNHMWTDNLYYLSHLINFFHQNGYFLNETLPYNVLVLYSTICNGISHSIWHNIAMLAVHGVGKSQKLALCISVADVRHNIVEMHLCK